MIRLFVIAAALVVLGGWLFRSHPKPGVDTPLVELYMASYCPESKRAKAYLEKHAIPFVEYDVEKSLSRRKEFYERGGKGIPLLFVRGKAIHGFDVRAFEQTYNFR
jgi:glutaredoxin